jgi:hypothetical protein
MDGCQPRFMGHDERLFAALAVLAGIGSTSIARPRASFVLMPPVDLIAC